MGKGKLGLAHLYAVQDVGGDVGNSQSAGEAIQKSTLEMSL